MQRSSRPYSPPSVIGKRPRRDSEQDSRDGTGETQWRSNVDHLNYLGLDIGTGSQNVQDVRFVKRPKITPGSGLLLPLHPQHTTHTSSAPPSTSPGLNYTDDTARQLAHTGRDSYEYQDFTTPPPAPSSTYNQSSRVPPHTLHPNHDIGAGSSYWPPPTLSQQPPFTETSLTLPRQDPPQPTLGNLDLSEHNHIPLNYSSWSFYHYDDFSPVPKLINRGNLQGSDHPRRSVGSSGQCYTETNDSYAETNQDSSASPSAAYDLSPPPLIHKPIPLPDIAHSHSSPSLLLDSPESASSDWPQQFPLPDTTQSAPQSRLEETDAEAPEAPIGQSSRRTSSQRVKAKVSQQATRDMACERARKMYELLPGKWKKYAEARKAPNTSFEDRSQKFPQKAVLEAVLDYLAHLCTHKVFVLPNDLEEADHPFLDQESEQAADTDISSLSDEIAQYNDHIAILEQALARYRMELSAKTSQQLALIQQGGIRQSDKMLATKPVKA